MTIIATDTDQVVICISHFYQHRPSKIWKGCLEVERKEYTAKDILHLADDKPEDIVKVLRIDVGSGSCDDITQEILDADA